ncbi:dienelactone hydrolase family protein [Sphingomicrobium aestuariivivum]|uniref:dienelactone hydrolase family protein n=1 Tax=Sphingomicrobium aestuariivivum TaxID=1582356 RepID=UPI001FD6A9FB|nr:dienelactone hydrolase family protein [Sphingomicrobium aestuariivivum]MCJ8190957.1 dienelactone hydrolase family protein [Sphingomicrobium aestuariivivum]
MCKRSPLDPDLLKMSRRRFAVLGLATTLAACAGGGMGSPKGLRERRVSISTASGTMDGFFVHPKGEASAAVIMWPDIAGLRPAFEVMARRLAATGRAVLVANQYYRTGTAPLFDDFADFREQEGFSKGRPWRQALTPEAIAADTRAIVNWLDEEDAVESDAGIGVQGYCMGGPFAFRSATARPDRIAAVASFHGGGLVTDAPDSPHRQLSGSEAAYLVAIAQDDDAEEPENKSVLRGAMAATGRPAEIEVYAGDHGWTVLDSPAYDEAAAERAFGRLRALYDRVLG